VSARTRSDARSAVERLLPDAFDGSAQSPLVSTFIRGVTTGALVGAAIAGSALWSRYRRTHHRSPDAATSTSAAGDPRA
jgi:hypothetical protein